MDKGKNYLVVYKDDDRARTKNLRFIEQVKGLLYFKNLQRNKIEIFPLSSIIRMEEMQ